MRATGRPRRALLVTAALVAVTFAAGCGQGSGSSPTTSGAEPSPTSSPEPTLDLSEVVFPADAKVPALSEVPAPSSADPTTGGVPVSAAGVGVAGQGDVVVDVYFDFMCPYCGLFDQVNAADLDALVAEGGVTVVFHPVAILDRASDTAYSTRAMNAFAVVADQAPDRVPDFVTALLAAGTQPAEGGHGLTDEQIAEAAQSVGVSTAVTDEFTATVRGVLGTGSSITTLRTFVPWTVAVTALLPAHPDGTRGTPSVLVDGQWFGGDWTQPGVLRAAVEAARA